MAIEPTTAPTRKKVRYSVALIAVIALLLSGCLSTGQSNALTAMNRDRNRSGLRSLSLQADAQAKAQGWANRLARENRLYHSTLTSGIRSRWCNLGENVGYGSATSSIEGSFMASSGHRANIVSSKWNGVGIGVASNGNRVFVVQVFIKTC